MKQYQMIEPRTNVQFVVKGLTAKDCVKQISYQLGYRPELIIMSSKRIH